LGGFMIINPEFHGSVAFNVNSKMHIFVLTDNT
jgi:hypothetical protein